MCVCVCVCARARDACVFYPHWVSMSIVSVAFVVNEMLFV